MERTLGGIPRVEGEPPESPAQHVRNAMTILSAWEQNQPDSIAVCLPKADYEIVYARLVRAVMMLENRTTR